MTITQIQYVNVQKILVVTFELTGEARGFMIMSCAARGVKKVGQHWPRPNSGQKPPVQIVSELFAGGFDRGFCQGVFSLEVLVRVVFFRSPFCQNTSVTT